MITADFRQIRRFYATFGVQYREELHPTLPPEYCNPDGVMLVLAPNMDIARRMVSAVTDNAYAFLHPWPEPWSEEHANMDRYFPVGVTCTLSIQSAEEEVISRDRVVSLLAAMSDRAVDDQDVWLIDELITHIRLGDNPDVAAPTVIKRIIG